MDNYGYAALAMLLVFIMLAVALIAPESDPGPSKQETACHSIGMEVISTSVWHGKYSTTYYACRSANGALYAIPREK